MLPPTPPPLPPMRNPQRQTVNAKLSQFSQSSDARDHVVAEGGLNSQAHINERAEKIDKPFQPCHMFFYGSLMDPEIIQAILGLPETPTLVKATLSGFRMKMWGIYPAVVADTSGQVTGRLWQVNDEDHFNRLAAYETAAYTWVECEARLDDDLVLKDCRTFCWAGRPDSKDLEDGAFDFERYQKYFKSSVVRRK